MRVPPLAWRQTLIDPAVGARRGVMTAAHMRLYGAGFAAGHSTKLSSAGLVYKHFGREIIASELGLAEADPTLEKIYLKVYKQFMEALDGIDNGVNQWCEANDPLTRPQAFRD